VKLKGNQAQQKMKSQLGSSDVY